MYNAKGMASYHSKKSKSSISSYSEGIKPKKGTKKFKGKSSEKYSSMKRNKKLTLDNSTMVLSSCNSKNLDETINTKKSHTKKKGKDITINSNLNISLFTNEFKDLKSLKKDMSKESSLDKKKTHQGFVSTKGTRNFNINLLKAQQRILRTQKDMNVTSEKSRNIKIVKSNTSKRDRNLEEIERQILSIEGSFSIEKKIKTLTEAFRNVINCYLQDVPYPVLSTLNLITQEFSSLFKRHKRGRDDVEAGASDNNFASTLHNVKGTYEKTLQEQKQDFERTLSKLKRDHSSEIKKIRGTAENAKKEAENIRTRYEAQLKDIQEKTKEKNDEVFNKMKHYINNELDLDNYNITSDDFRNDTSRLKKRLIKANDVKGHPLVPKLDLQEIIEVRELANQLEGEEDLESEYECDINDEEGVQESSRPHFFDGSQIVTSQNRQQMLEDRKKYIIHVFNQAYSESSADNTIDGSAH